MDEGRLLEDFDDTPEGNAQRISAELEASKKTLERWHTQAKKIVDEFLDRGSLEERSTYNRTFDHKWNLFWSDTTTKECILFGKTPKVDVSRRFGDAKDQEGRVAGELLERILNYDIESNSDANFSFSLWCAIKDFMLAGIGVIKFRYCCKMEDVEGVPAKMGADGQELAPEVPTQQRKSSEDVETDYVHWRDIRWSAGARIFPEVRWVSFKNPMSRQQLIDRFAEPLGRMFGPHDEESEGETAEEEELESAGDEEEEGLEAQAPLTDKQRQVGEAMARSIPLNSKRGEGAAKEEPHKRHDPWAKADVWEFWDKEQKKVYWYVEGMPHVLDAQDDPLGLSGFWPFPRFMVDNWTTTELIPRPTFVLVQDLYISVNQLSTRIKNLESALQVKGVYDATNEELKRLINEAKDGEMIPVKNWLMFGDKGGVAKAFEMFPLREVAETVMNLRQARQEEITALRQITGMGDILRGQAQDNGTPGEAQLEAKFGSVRMQALQNEIARFASEGQAIRAEIIARHFDPQTILERSNAARTFDAEQAPVLAAAVQLIKEHHYDYRITVKPESVALEDFGAMKAEAVELLDAVGRFFQQVSPLVQSSPQAMPLVSELFQWAISRVKGGKEIEGVVSRLGQALSQPQQQQQQPNPEAMRMQAQQQQQQFKMAELQAKGQQEQVKIRSELQADLARDQAEASQEEQQEQAELNRSIREAQVRERLKVEAQRQIDANRHMMRRPTNGGTP